jgi:hypothetical protein
MMETDYFIHPQRFPKNVEGPFYTLGDQDKDGIWCGSCLSCAIPEAEAPSLLAALDDNNADTYFVRQPETEEEIEQACMAADVCCVSAIRYGGTNPAILQRLGASYCDNAVPLKVNETTLSNSRKPWWRFWA